MKIIINICVLYDGSEDLREIMKETIMIYKTSDNEQIVKINLILT